MSIFRSPSAKVFFAICLALLLAIVLLRTNAAGSTITATWSYDYTPMPACSAALAKNCIDHFEIQDITNQSSHRLIQTLANPSGSLGKVDGITTSFKFGPILHESVIAVVAVGRDDDGNRTASNPYAARATLKRGAGAKVHVAF